MKMFKQFASTFAIVFATLGAVAHAQDSPDKAYIDKIWHGTYDVEADGRVTETVVHRFQVLQEGRLEQFKVYSYSYSTSIQTGEVLEAYTLKKDGRHIPVPAANYQTQINQGRGQAGPAFSDRTRVSVVFPDLAVGDSVHIAYKLVEREPMFPGQFSMVRTFSPFGATEDARVTVRLPQTMEVKTEAHHMVAQPAVTSAGKRTLEWRYANTTPRPYSEDDDSGLWSIEESPVVMVSTFATYEAIAAAYGARALPKAQPSTRVRELAREVIGKETLPREKARLLYEWVSRNITYGGNCIGVGAVVPREVDGVLDNKMGDCKDHATLLQALLAAANVISEQVLINAGDQYELPQTPVVSMVNHVMNYLPELQVYVDATAKDIPFGYLPQGTYGKPVIHVGARQALATVANDKHELNEQRLQMNLKLDSNGSASGTMQVALKGVQAARARAYFRELTGEGEKDFVKNTLSRAGLRGRGALQRNSTQGLSDQYAFSIAFEIDNYLRGGANGGFYLAPVVGTPMAVMNFAGAQDRPAQKRRTPCGGFHSYETYEIDLPANIRLISMPDDAQVNGSLLDFKARYEKTSSGLRVNREVHDKTPVSVCSIAMSAEFAKQVGPIGENLSTQLLYKRSSP